MAMRAMVNTGIKNLRLVAPIHGWPNKKAELASAEKSDFLSVEIFNNFSEAISDLNLVFATSARSRNLIKKSYSPESFIREISSSSLRTETKIGIVFGAEKDGLSNEEISLCNGVIEIPSVDFSSYNLSQAVLIICYHIMSETINKKLDESQLKMGKTCLATKKEEEFFLEKLELELQKRNYFPSAEKKILMMQTIRNLFKRSCLAKQEIQSMMGVICALSESKI